MNEPALLDTALEPPSPAEVRAPARTAKPIATRASFPARVAMMGRVGLAMMFHDKSKLIGTIFGVIFAVVLSNQQAGIFLGLMQRNVMLVENAGADLWVAPKASESFFSAAGQFINAASLNRARTTPGVAWAEPILMTVASVHLPQGGSQQVQIIGTRLPECRGGPWNLVAGSCDDLRRPDTIIVEHGDRLNLGGLNVGSVREINGRNMTVVGLTWGLIPFGPSYAFTDFETARELAHTDSDLASFALVGLTPDADADAVRAALTGNASDIRVMSKAEFKDSIVKDVLTRTALGVTFGTSTAFGLIVGLVIVALSMFSAVVDNVREFGTLKALGCTNLDLSLLLFVQSMAYALLGSLIGLALVTRMGAGMRSAKLALILPPWLTFGSFVLMVVLCTFASLIALLRVRKVEPAMVFR